MKFRIRFADQIVGLFILLAVLGLAGILILIGANQRWFAKNYHYYSRFNSAASLSVGQSIKLKGFEIGKVNTISLTPQNQVDIEFYIFDTYYEKVRPNSVLELAVNPLGIGGGLSFHPGKNNLSPLEELSFIPSLDLEQGKELVKKDLVDMPKGQDEIVAIMNKVGPIMDEVYSALASTNTLIASINDAITGHGEGPVAEMLAQLTVTTTKVSESMYNVKGILANIEDITSEPTGLVTRLLDPKGSIATLLDDDNVIFNQILIALEEVNAIIAQLSDFTKYVNSTQPQISGLLEKSKVALDEGKDVLEAVKNNPLLRGGITEKREQQTTFQSYRDEDF